MYDIDKLDWTIKKEFKPIDDIPEDELDNAPNPWSEGFWWDVDSGNAYKFIELLESEETREACWNALKVIHTLEEETSDYVGEM